MVDDLIGGLGISGGSLVSGGGVGDDLDGLGVDVIVELDVALGQLSVPAVDGVVTSAGLDLSVLQGLTLVAAVATIGNDFPIEFIGRSVLKRIIR